MLLNFSVVLNPPSKPFLFCFFLELLLNIQQIWQGCSCKTSKEKNCSRLRCYLMVGFVVRSENNGTVETWF